MNSTVSYIQLFLKSTINNNKFNMDIFCHEYFMKNYINIFENLKNAYSNYEPNDVYNKFQN